MNNKIFDLYKIDYLTKYNKYFNFIQEYENDIDVLEVLPISLTDQYEIDLENATEEVVYLDKENYLDRLRKYESLFTKISGAFINKLLLKSYLELEKNESIKTTLRGFKAQLSGYAPKSKFTNLKTISGRLTVESGPNCLTLPARYRGIVKSSFRSGKILSFDFKSLEPRICLKLAGRDTESEDIYEQVNDLLSFNADRSIIKRATISLLYGSGLKGLEGLSNERAKELIEIVSDFFGYDKVVEMAQIVNENGRRKNFFGRPINNLMETKKHILTNNFVQSTAVDLALTYFSKLVDLVDLNLARPLFIIHDAIVFDVEDDYEPFIREIISKGYRDEKLGYFPLKIENFS